MKNLTIEAIARECKGVYYGPDALRKKEIKGAVIDSRKVEDGYLFFAVKGERVDGHDFAADVYKKGAICMIAERKPDAEIPYILVENSLDALKKTAAFYREQLSVRVVGISGSVGKTSTKEFVAAVLKQKFRIHKTQGNFNNEIGVPLTLLQIKETDEIAVVEMGISDFGEMHRLSSMAKPDICILTNVGYCHLENLKDRDGVLKAKSEMFDFAAEDAVVILNGDDDKLQTIGARNGRLPVFYGMDERNTVYAKEIRTDIDKTEVTIVFGNGAEVRASFEVPGRHMVYNAMAAAAVGELFGMTPEEIAEGIRQVKPVGGRLHLIDTGRYRIIDDCYNANPVSVKSSLGVLQLAPGRKVAILGDMFELGEKERELHYGVGEAFREYEIDVAIFAGKLSAATWEGVQKSGAKTECYYYETLDDLLMFLDLQVKPGDTILVKASHSMHFEKIVEYLKEEVEDGKDKSIF